MRDSGPGLLQQRIPKSITRLGRIELLAAVAAALLRNELPSREAALFVGSALLAFLQTGDALERHLRVGAPRGSHHKPNVLFRKFIGHERLSDEGVADSTGIIATDKD